MGVSMEEIKQLREETSCGVIDCKKALEQAAGDIVKAKAILRERGLEMAAKKSHRLAKQGRVESYVHMGNNIGVLLEVNCETDFVARSEDFVRFTKDLALHIAAMNPTWISADEIPTGLAGSEKERTLLIKEKCLLDQAFVRDPGMTIQDYLNSLIAKIGENIVIRRFVRYQVGQNDG